MPLSIAENIQYLWHHPVIQEAYKHRSEFYFLDASE